MKQPRTLIPPSKVQSAFDGCQAFAALCDYLIDEEGLDFLYPVVVRYGGEWHAEVYTRPKDDERSVKLASAKGRSMWEACANAHADFHERRRVRARKEELMKDPNVQEALKLFGVEPQDE